jgi:hypothetical protein
MNTHMIPALSLCAALLAVGSGRAGELPSREGTLRQFQDAVETYAQLHRRLEQDVPPLTAASNPREIIASSKALAARIRAARATAREGDFFTAEEGDAFRVVIARALYTHHFTADDMIAAGREEAPPLLPKLTVNTRFPWAHGAAVWPCVLLALPQLPEELEYRFIGRDLVLVDVHANLVVDILREALRPTT